MTMDEAKAVIALAGWRLEIWESHNHGVWFYDVWSQEDSADYIRDSIARLPSKAEQAFLEWCARGMPKEIEGRDDL